MDVRHSGQPLSIEATVSAQLSQNSRMAARHKGDASARGNQTSQQSVDCGDCAAVSVALVSLDGVVTSCRGSCCCGALSSSLISEFQLLFKFHHFHRNSGPVIFVSRHYPMDVLTKVWFIWPVIFQSYIFQFLLFGPSFSGPAFSIPAFSAPFKMVPVPDIYYQLLTVTFTDLDFADDVSLWRMMSTYGATQS